ncbi:hypothetical protein [Paraburkholderia megapolitana]|nr:hypothetical protein [Paraburkholderia megapolitana]QDQ80628.1 hypothetical protein FNZ07_05285 [Paraburkholderia megapolitana]
MRRNSAPPALPPKTPLDSTGSGAAQPDPAAMFKQMFWGPTPDRRHSMPDLGGAQAGSRPPVPPKTPELPPKVPLPPLKVPLQSTNNMTGAHGGPAMPSQHTRPSSPTGSMLSGSTLYSQSANSSTTTLHNTSTHGSSAGGGKPLQSTGAGVKPQNSFRATLSSWGRKFAAFARGNGDYTEQTSGPKPQYVSAAQSRRNSRLERYDTGNSETLTGGYGDGKYDRK